ncbi:ATP-dependent DNA helicase RecG [Thermodesulfobacteriota bacterium]
MSNNNLNLIEESVSALLHALLYVKKDDFKNLTSTKDLEKFVLLKTDSIISACDDGFRASDFKKLYPIFKGYENKSIELKKSAVVSAIEILNQERSSSDIKEQTKNADDEPDISAKIAYENSVKLLESPVLSILGVGEKLSQTLNKKGISILQDVLFYLPYKYDDMTRIRKISELTVGEAALFHAKIIDFAVVNYGRRRTFEAVVADETGSITLKWFKYNQYLTKNFKRGEMMIVTGVVKHYNFAREMQHPQVKMLSAVDHENIDTKLEDLSGILPVYSETEGLKQYTIRKIVHNAVLNLSSHYLSPLDLSISKELGMPNINEAIKNLHIVDKKEDVEELNSFKSKYHERIIFEEFFYFELALALRKKGRILKRGIKFDNLADCCADLKKVIPFKLTSAQDKVVDEIMADIAAEKPINRLIQGDVGSGKTIVALFALYFAAKNSYQAAIMAPTEILATQHYKNLKKYFDELGISVALLTGSLKKKEREAILEKIASGETKVIIGTHAVIQDSVKMKRLGLVVIDEQHRFGVMQRTTLMKKGGKSKTKTSEERLPHVLIMTATPIPRTLAITVYGDLDVSIIDEMPPGRKPVKTKVYYESQRDTVYKHIAKELKAGNQAYIVYPLVAESDKLELMDATNMSEHLQNDIFPDFKLGLLHGRMKSGDKSDIMLRFKNREIDILVATTVIEVGIDVPSASIMVVEHAERFGLSQLHQLRGRVGRGGVEATCILLAQYKKSEESTRRLKVMEQTNDGFKIAEEDLNIRGPGEMLGTRQSGIPDFQVASLIRDLPILKIARKSAFALIHEDSKLENGINTIIKKELIRRMKGKLELASIG